MEYKLLEKQDAQLMKDFIDDERTEYNSALLEAFLEEKNVYAYVAKEDSSIVGFAYGYVLIRPDGKRDFYLHAIDVMESYQKRGYGTELMKYIHAHSKSIGCRKMFLITNKSNTSACKCYEKAGGVSQTADDIVYAFEE